MKQDIFIGIDGGGSKSSIRLEDAEQRLLATALGGPANIRVSPAEAWAVINRLIDNTLLQQQLQKNEVNLHVGMGLAGCEAKTALREFKSYAHDFQHLIIQTDAHTACLGAHAGQDGSIIIAGTGAVGYQIRGNQVVKVGGWGFPYDDRGSGAWIGFEAIRYTLQYIDGRMGHGPLVEKLYQHFGGEVDRLIDWVSVATSRDFAVFAPWVIETAQSGDSLSKQLLQHAAAEIDLIAEQLLKNANLPICLLGGVAPFLIPYLASHVQLMLKPALLPADQGAIEMVKQHMRKYNVAYSDLRLATIS